MQPDALDQIAAKAFEGYLVHKDLVRQFKGQYPVPTYVAEFLLGRYCASVEELEIQEGLIVMDGREAFVSGGPDKGELVRPDLVLASGDLIAIDAEAMKTLLTYGAKNKLSTDP